MRSFRSIDSRMYLEFSAIEVLLKALKCVGALLVAYSPIPLAVHMLTPHPCTFLGPPPKDTVLEILNLILLNDIL